jgi:bidirectional [NiFe] hydrogenase diaphorase subunit
MFIIRNGGEWFASIGTASSKGTKVFALAGKLRSLVRSRADGTR